MAEHAKMTSIEPQHRAGLPEASWQDLDQPCAYVERGTGDLYRFPKEALIPGASPVIRKESLGASRLVQLSENPFVTTLEARTLACERNIPPISDGGPSPPSCAATMTLRSVRGVGKEVSRGGPPLLRGPAPRRSAGFAAGRSPRRPLPMADWAP